MIKQILKLDSVGPNTIGGSTCEAISIFYSYLLKEYKQDFYTYILINHINSEELEERIVKLGVRQIAVNVKCAINVDLKETDDRVLVEIQTEIIERGLEMISKETGNIHFEIISRIREQISSTKFIINIPILFYKSKSKYVIDCYLSLVPQVREFNFYINYTIEKNSDKYCKRVQVFSGHCSLYYINYFFKKMESFPDLIILSGDFDGLQFVIYLDDSECYISNKNVIDLQKDLGDVISPRFLSIIKKSNLVVSEVNFDNKRSGIKIDFD